MSSKSIPEKGALYKAVTGAKNKASRIRKMQHSPTLKAITTARSPVYTADDGILAGPPWAEPFCGHEPGDAPEGDSDRGQASNRGRESNQGRASNRPLNAFPALTDLFQVGQSLIWGRWVVTVRAIQANSIAVLGSPLWRKLMKRNTSVRFDGIPMKVIGKDEVMVHFEQE